MKTFILDILLFLCFVAPLDAAVITRPESKVSPGLRWLNPISVTLHSDNGDVVAVRQRGILARPDSADVKIVLVSSDSLRSALLAVECDNYAVIKGQIVGLRTVRSNAEILLPNLDTVFSDESQIGTKIDGFLKEVDEQLLGRGDDANTHRFSILHIFGDMQMSRKPDTVPIASLPQEQFRVVGCSFSFSNLVVDFDSTSNRKLQLSFDSSFAVTLASENGVPVRLLTSGRASLSTPWSIPLRKRMVHPSGTITIPGRGQTASAGAVGDLTVDSVTAVWADDGKFWIGPTPCQLVDFGSAIVGVRMDYSNPTLLYIYKNSTVIPLDRDGTTKFERQLRDFDALLPAGGTARLTHTTIDVADLFPDLPNLAEYDLGYASMDYIGDNLEIRLTTNNPNVRLAIELNSQFVAVSGRKIDFQPPSNK